MGEPSAFERTEHSTGSATTDTLGGKSRKH